MLPSQGVDAVAVHEFARGAVGFVGVPDHLAFVPDNAGDEASEFADGQVFAGAHIDEIPAVVFLHEEQASGGEVIDVQEFPPGRPGSPAGHARGA